MEKNDTLNITCSIMSTISSFSTLNNYSFWPFDISAIHFKEKLKPIRDIFCIRVKKNYSRVPMWIRHAILQMDCYLKLCLHFYQAISDNHYFLMIFPSQSKFSLVKFVLPVPPPFKNTCKFICSGGGKKGSKHPEEKDWSEHQEYVSQDKCFWF